VEIGPLDCLKLKASDLKAPRRDRGQVTEGQHELSWIWLVQRDDSATEVSEDEIGDSEFTCQSSIVFSLTFCFQGLRIEWAKSCARTAWWCEEVDLLDEEMRRVLCFLDWKSAWWVKMGVARSNVAGHL
jgi:hypothetical protein